MTDYKDIKIQELENEIERLERFSGYRKTDYHDYPYRRLNSGGYWELCAEMNENEILEAEASWRGGQREYMKERGRSPLKTILEHRYLIQKKLGHKIPPGYVVHHKDGNKRNNALANLEPLTRTEHLKEHMRMKKTENESRAEFIERNKAYWDDYFIQKKKGLIDQEEVRSWHPKHRIHAGGIRV